MFKVRISLNALFKILIKQDFKIQTNYKDMEGGKYILFMQVGNSDNSLFYNLETMQIIHAKGIFFNQLIQELSIHEDSI